MLNVYGTGYTPEQRLKYTGAIIVTVLRSLASLIDAANELDASLGTTVTLAETQNSIKFIQSLDESAGPFDQEFGIHAATVWADRAIQNCYRHRSKFQLNDSCEYFLSKIVEITTPGYVPTQQDVLYGHPVWRPALRSSDNVEQSSPGPDDRHTGEAVHSEPDEIQDD